MNWGEKCLKASNISCCLFFHFMLHLLRRSFCTSPLLSTMANNINQSVNVIKFDVGDKKDGLLIGTHSGHFHCDEAMACFLLLQTEKFRNAKIVRSRDPKVLELMDVVVDVGGVYDAEALRFDHHQKEFTTNFPGRDIKLSSAGLVYMHMGKEVLKNIGDLNEQQTNVIYQTMYDGLILSLDAIDNGVSIGEGAPKYKVSTDLSSRVGRLNPSWLEENPDHDGNFEKAVALTGAEFVDVFNGYVKNWLPAREIVEVAMKEENRLGEAKNIVRLERGCPWKDHLQTIEKEMELKEKIQFVLYPDNTGAYRIQAVGITPDSFQLRTGIHSEWRGLRDEKLSEASGIPGGVFVHANGFIGGNKTYEGALKMAEETLKLAK